MLNEKFQIMNVQLRFGKIREVRINYLFSDIIIKFKADFATAIETLNCNTNTENTKLENNITSSLSSKLTQIFRAESQTFLNN